jgi:hypothetical protein
LFREQVKEMSLLADPELADRWPAELRKVERKERRRDAPTQFIPVCKDIALEVAEIRPSAPDGKRRQKLYKLVTQS